MLCTSPFNGSGVPTSNAVLFAVVQHAMACHNQLAFNTVQEQAVHMSE